jgi:hypothetical protein
MSLMFQDNGDYELHRKEFRGGNVYIQLWIWVFGFLGRWSVSYEPKQCSTFQELKSTSRKARVMTTISRIHHGIMFILFFQGQYFGYSLSAILTVVSSILCCPFNFLFLLGRNVIMWGFRRSKKPHKTLRMDA